MSSPSAETVRPHAGHGCTVLVVDDDPKDTALIKRQLPEYEVLTARSGEEALQLLAVRWHEIHVCLADQTMPGMSGVELLATISRSYRSVMPVLISGVADKLILAAAVNRATLAGFLDKTQIATKTREVVQAACERRREQQGSHEDMLHGLRQAEIERTAMGATLRDMALEGRVRGEQTSGKLARIEDVQAKHTGSIDFLVGQYRGLGTRVTGVERRQDEAEHSSPGIAVDTVLLQEVRRQQTSIADHESDIGRIEAQLAAIVGAPTPAADGSSKPPPTLVTIAADGEARGAKIEKQAKSGIIVAGAIVASAEVVLEVLKHVWK